MKHAYVDTSCLVAIALEEEIGSRVQKVIERYDLWTSSLLEAELSAAMRRNGQIVNPHILDLLSWVLPLRRLTPEIAIVLGAGYVRGADLMHIATALYLAGNATSLSFLTLDQQQAAVARSLGFTVPALA